MRLFSYISMAGLLFFSQEVCAQGTKSNLLNGDSIAVIQMGEPMPDSCTVIDQVKVGDNGYEMGRGYPAILDFAKLLTWRAKGNVLQIKTIRPPDSWCDSYRLYGTMLYRKNIGNINTHKVEDSLKKAKFGANPKFATLYLFWPQEFIHGENIRYTVKIGDSIIGKISINKGYEINLFKEGKINITGETLVDSKGQMQLDVKFGNEYYVACGTIQEPFGDKPGIILMPDDIGQVQYKFILLKSKVTRCTYSSPAPAYKEDDDQ